MNIPQKIGSKLRRESRYLGRDIGHLLGFDEKFLKNARGSRILIYHGICQTDHTRFNPIFLKLKTFERHLEFYQKYFNVISLDDFYQQRFSNDKFNICITFDDGYANNHKYVLSLLKKYQTPAAFFITAIRNAGYDILWNDFLGLVQKYGPEKILYKSEQFYKGNYNKYISAQSGLSLVEMLRQGDFEVKAEMINLLYPLAPYRENNPGDEDYWLQMTREQIRELSASPFVTVGSHGYYHNDLARIPLNDAMDELTRSKQYLEDIIDQPVNSLAFPYGSYTRDVVHAAKNAGYDQLLAMDFHFDEDHADKTMKERFTVNPFISPANQMHATITGSYER
ncbi:MAG TPA: polysaccharide deacetylase family protein [Mucilaginibacter sp.]|nr:polysaccharide deacetylase family protein [Mucilaginibacter sp.]